MDSLIVAAACGFGAHEDLARARCVVAEAEVALAMRDLGGSPRTWWHRSRRRATAATRASPGPRAARGWAKYRDRKIHQIDPATGTVLRTIESNRFVTGVTWVDGELWHGTWEGDESDIRRLDPESGAVLERLQMPAGVGVSGLESDGADLFYCGGGPSGKVRVVRRPG